MGICSGSLVATAAMSASSVEELLAIAPKIACVALRLGLLANQRAELIERSEERWASAISGISEENLMSLIQANNEEKVGFLSVEGQAYV